MWTKAFLGLVLIYVLSIVFHLLYTFGFHKTVYIRLPGPCRNVPPVVTGAEDIDVTSGGLAFISSGIDLEYRGDNQDPRIKDFKGRIYLFDFNHPDKDALELDLDIGFPLRPHGIDIYEAPNSGDIRVFVVNHRNGEDSVEIFSFDKKETSLKHELSVFDKSIVSINDIVATGPTSFYATNDGYFRNSTFRTFERFAMRPWGSVIFYDGTDAVKIVPSAFEPNGLALSPDGKFLYVDCPFNQVVNIYRRNSDNSLDFIRELKIGTLADNNFINPANGDLWLACHLKAHLLIEEIANINLRSPAQVIMVRPTGPAEDPFKTHKIFEVFADDGQLLSASSGVAFYDNKILVGSMVGKLAICEINTPLH